MSVFTKAPDLLTEEELAQLKLAEALLASGKSLHGPDLDHVNWVLANLVHLLDVDAAEHGFAVTYIELKRDPEGYGIAILDVGKQGTP